MLFSHFGCFVSCPPGLIISLRANSDSANSSAIYLVQESEQLKYCFVFTEFTKKKKTLSSSTHAQTLCALQPLPLPCSGGGYKGFCDYEEIKEAIKECDGLDGARLEACYAQFGCDVDKVTEHYAKAAGIDKKKTGDGKVV